MKNMKKLLIVFLALVSFSSFASDSEKSCTTVFGKRVCAEIEGVGMDIYIQNFEPNIPASKAAATILCENADADMPYTKVKFKTKKSANGEKVFSEVRCKHQERRLIMDWVG